MAYIRKIKASLVRLDSSDYLGEDTYLFFDIEKNCLRVSDGITPGGHPACIEWAGVGNKPSPTITLQGDVTGNTTLVELQDAIMVTQVPELSNKVDWSVVGQPNGVASLGPDGIVPTQQLPTSLDEELLFGSLTAFSIPGDSTKLYISIDTNEIYRWDGTNYIPLSSNVDNTLLEHSDPVQIAPPQTEAIFSFVAEGNTSTKFIIHASDKIDGRFRSSEVLCSVNNELSTVSFTHYAITGDLLKLNVSMDYVGNIVTLYLTNNDSHPVIASATRIPTIIL